MVQALVAAKVNFDNDTQIDQWRQFCEGGEGARIPNYPPLFNMFTCLIKFISS